MKTRVQRWKQECRGENKRAEAEDGEKRIFERGMVVSICAHVEEPQERTGGMKLNFFDQMVGTYAFFLLGWSNVDILAPYY